MNSYKKILEKILNIFFSIPTSIFLLFIFAFLVGYATFVENDYSTQTARALIYNNVLFEILLILIVINLIGNIIINKMFTIKKIIPFIFHSSFVFIALGALITRYIGYEGVMSIKEGSLKSYMLSGDIYLMANLEHDKTMQNFSKKLILSEIYKKYLNSFSDDVKIKDNIVKITYKDYIKNGDVIIKKDVPNGDTILNFALSTGGEPHNIFLKYGESLTLNSGKTVSFFDDNEASIKIEIFNGNLFITSDENISRLEMATEKLSFLSKNVSHLFETKRLYKSGNINIVIKSFNENAKMTFASRLKAEQILDVLILDVSLNGESKEFVLFGDKNIIPISLKQKIGDVSISLAYGSKVYHLPFSIGLYDFILDRYPGSNSPSSFKSEVRLLDNRFGIDDNTSIFMNNVLYHDGYRFYQSSYFPDESGTILSVNKDHMGTVVTYVGYFLLMFGLILTIFNPKGRIRKLRSKLHKLRDTLVVVLAVLPMYSYSLDVNSTNTIEEIKKIDYEHSQKLSTLQVQDISGRIKPFDTISGDIVRKISGKTSLFGMDTNQIFLSMITKPSLWQSVKMIKVKNKRIKSILGVDEKAKYIAFKIFFDYQSDDVYKLVSFVEAAHQKKPALRSTFDRDVIKIDEKVNIMYMVYTGLFLNIFPNPNDKEDLTWYSPTDAISKFKLKDGNFIRNILATYFSSIEKAGEDGNWSKADNILSLLKIYQQKTSTIYKTDDEITLEILYNNLNIFDRLTYLYLILALVFMALSIWAIFKNNSDVDRYIIYAKRVLLVGFIIHFIGLALRWMIGGHAPWSNGYESMIYVSFIIVLATYVICRKSFLILTGATLIAGITLFVAHLNWMNPEITNLVPVLKSYWLSIHVSIITASYGFFAISFILGIFYMFMVLSLNENNKDMVSKYMKEISYINEISIYIGLIFLTIGNFLGGIWANESWGRYWGWDAKETWALVSILLYAIIAHFRFIPLLKSYFVFNVATILGFYSILMTYFGVNFYLSGLHSYAQGDPLEIPMWVYYLSSFIIFLIFIAYMKSRKYKNTIS